MNDNVEDFSEPSKHRILLVDDDRNVLDMLSEFLTEAGPYSVVSENRSDRAPRLVRDNDFDLILLDIMMEPMNGFQVMAKITAIDPTLPVIAITCFATNDVTSRARECGMKTVWSKAGDDWDHLLMHIREQLPSEEDISCVRFRNGQAERPGDWLSFDSEGEEHEIVGRSPAMAHVFEDCWNTAKSSDRSNVLITGETGVGKELVARYIHSLSPFADKPYVTLAVNAVSEGLFESELFGHCRGSFTGAEKDKPGKFGIAGDGTILLDEISHLKPDLQTKLLRALQERKYYPVGGNELKPLKARVIAAGVDLDRLVKTGQFKRELYERLKVFHIKLPPLRDRKTDIPLLVRHFVDKHWRGRAGEAPIVPDKTFDHLIEHNWQGNVRALENAVRYALATCRGNYLLPMHFPLEDGEGSVSSRSIRESILNLNHKEAKIELQRDFYLQYIPHILQKHNGNVTKAADSIGISRERLHQLIRYYKIDSHRKKV